MLKIRTRVFKIKKGETFSTLMKRVNRFLSSKLDEGYIVQKYIVDREMVAVDYWIDY